MNITYSKVIVGDYAAVPVEDPLILQRRRTGYTKKIIPSVFIYFHAKDSQMLKFRSG